MEPMNAGVPNPLPAAPAISFTKPTLEQRLDWIEDALAYQRTERERIWWLAYAFLFGVAVGGYIAARA